MTINAKRLPPKGTPYPFSDFEAGKLPPESWDCADAIDGDGWTARELDAFMRATAKPYVPPTPPKPDEPADKPVEHVAPVAGPSQPVAAPKPVSEPAQEASKRKPADEPSEPIFIVKGEVYRAVDLAVAVLSRPDLGVYARGDDLVRVVTHRTPSDTLTVAKQGENMRRPDGSVVISRITEAALVETLTRHAAFKKYDGRSGDFVPCDCPPEVARMTLDRRGYGWTMPRLKAVIAAPTLRPDFTVLYEPGYDAATGLLLAGDRLWRQIPDKPTKRDALDALDVLCEPIEALPFVDNSDRAGAVALLLSSVMRPALKTVPMFAVTAPMAGTGKSLMIDIAAIMATGRPATVVTPTADEAELEKRIGASALAGDQIISLDNVSHILRSDQLCQMLTQDAVKVRILGQSKEVRIPSTTLICCTGNNLSLFGDLNRRTIRIRLDAKSERPEERSFGFNPLELAIRKRAELVAAALTIVRAYLGAGAPNKASPMGSFEDWSDAVRSPLIWLGFGDCRGNIEEMRADDPEKAELGDILDVLPNGPFTSREIAHKVTENPTLREVLSGFIERSGALSTRRFGRYLLRYAGTRIGGRWIERVKDDGHSATWQVHSDRADRQEPDHPVF